MRRSADEDRKEFVPTSSTNGSWYADNINLTYVLLAGTENTNKRHSRETRRDSLGHGIRFPPSANTLVVVSLRVLEDVNMKIAKQHGRGRGANSQHSRTKSAGRLPVSLHGEVEGGDLLLYLLISSEKKERVFSLFKSPPCVLQF